MVFIKISQDLQENISVGFSVGRLQLHFKKETPAQLFICEFCENFKKTVLKEHLRVIASIHYFFAFSSSGASCIAVWKLSANSQLKALERGLFSQAARGVGWRRATLMKKEPHHKCLFAKFVKYFNTVTLLVTSSPELYFG